MSVKTAIDRIKQNIVNAYAVLTALGADLPDEQNSDNLATTAGTAKVLLYIKQVLTDAQKGQARENIGAGTSNFSGSYNDLTDTPTIPSAYTHPTTSGNKHIPSGGSSGQILRWSADGTAVWGDENGSTYTHPSTHPASMISAGTFAGQVKANSSGQTPGTALLRNIALYSEATDPTVNGQINFTYE